MNILLAILGIASIGLIFVREIGYAWKIKPFTCELCMSFWIAVLYFHSIEGILYGFLAGAISTFISRYI
jgi:hypothetical protein